MKRAAIKVNDMRIVLDGLTGWAAMDESKIVGSDLQTLYGIHFTYKCGSGARINFETFEERNKLLAAIDDFFDVTVVTW